MLVVIPIATARMKALLKVLYWPRVMSQLGLYPRALAGAVQTNGFWEYSPYNGFLIFPPIWLNGVHSTVKPAIYRSEVSQILTGSSEHSTLDTIGTKAAMIPISKTTDP